MGVSSDIPSNHQGRAMNNPSPQERANMFLVHMTMVMDGAVKKWQCVLCGKMAKLKADILDHVEAKHMENSFQYHCRYCTKVLNTNGNLRTHELHLSTSTGAMRDKLHDTRSVRDALRDTSE